MRGLDETVQIHQEVGGTAAYEVLANSKTSKEGEAELSLGCFQQRRELLTRTVDTVGWWKEHCKELWNLTD